MAAGPHSVPTIKLIASLYISGQVLNPQIISSAFTFLIIDCTYENNWDKEFVCCFPHALPAAPNSVMYMWILV